MSEVSCNTCVGACCSNVRVILSADEAERLEKAGTKLTTVLMAMRPLFPDADIDEDERFSWSDEADSIEAFAKSQKLPKDGILWMDIANQARHMEPDQGMFVISGDCGFLQEDRTCGDYDNRPDVCRKFPVGSVACLGFREKAEVDIPIQLTQKPVVG